jgi:hypothetical protein
VTYTKEELESLIKDLRSKGLEDDFIKRQLIDRDVDKELINEVLEKPSSKQEEIFMNSLSFVFDNLLIIFLSLIVVTSIIWSLVNTMNFIKYFPIIFVASLGASILGLIIKGGIDLIQVNKPDKSKNTYGKSFILGFFLLIFMTIFGLPVSFFGWFLYTVFFLIPVYIYFMVFYDLVQSETYPLVLALLFVSYPLVWLLPQVLVFVTYFLADLFGMRIVEYMGNFYIVP